MINRVKQDRTLRIAAQKCFPNVAHQVLISKLKKNGIKVGVVTNSIRQTSEFMLTYAGIFELLDILVTNQDVIEAKPDPSCYVLAMNKLSVTPEETIVVEDSSYGIAAGMASGAKVIKVNSVEDVSLDLMYSHIPEIF
jgi:HAD superfamily hydrolase (TIGR01509 family)